MKLCIVSNSLSGGGAETTMRELNRQFNLQGMKSSLICLNTTEGDSPEKTEIVLKRKWKGGIATTLKTLSEFNKIVSEIKPEVMILNCELPELFGALIATQKIQLIGVEHTSGPWFRRKPLGYIVRLLLKLKSTRWVSVNNDQKYIWPYRNRCFNIPNPLRDGVLQHTETELAAPFVFVGRLREEKDPEIVLTAARPLHAKVDIFGDGELQEKLKSHFSDVGVFHGFVNNPWEKISIDQVVVVPSKFEGDGLVIVEAIARNQPILLRDNQDLRRFQLEEHNYFSSLDSLSTKMQEVIMNGPSKYRPTQSKTREYLTNRNLNSVCKQWLNYLGM